MTKSPTHPSLVEVLHKPGAFASGAYSLVSLPAGALFTSITNATPTTTKAYSSVQVSPTQHIELNSDLVYCNHSCDPSVIFDMDKMEIRVVEGKDLKKGDAITFFYPSTEWEMAQPFECTCGAGGGKCKGLIQGAGKMEEKDLEGYWLSGHIRDMLAEKKRQQQKPNGHHL